VPRLKVAVVGAGNMAGEHIRAFADVPNVEIAGIHSRTRSRAEELAREHGIPAVCDSVEELHEATGAELAVVAVSETSMNAVSRSCFEYPWAVLLEKPPGYSLAVGEDILQAAVEAGSRVYVGLNRRFLSSTRAALADLESRSGPRFIPCRTSKTCPPRRLWDTRARSSTTGCTPTLSMSSTTSGCSDTATW
jgi:predicted dehydrogenase